MESDLSVSYEKLVIDNEILGMNQRVLRGIEVNDDTLAVEPISKVCRESGSNRHFLAERHTVDHMRSEHFFPTIANREKRARYHADDNALARARAFVTEIRSTEPESLIDPVIRKNLIAAYPEIIRYLS
jgi:trimethylamine--corrinoid protein Co-methyltransferase